MFEELATRLPPSLLHFLEVRINVVAAAYTYSEILQKVAYDGYVTFRSSFPVAQNEFAERFRYDLISSTLLSSTIPVTPLPSHHRARPSTPDAVIPGQLAPQATDDEEKTETERRSFANTLALLGFAALFSQYRLLSFVAFAAALALLRTPEPHASSRPHSSSIQQALDQLKDAGTSWDATINECMSVVDREERGYVC